MKQAQLNQKLVIFFGFLLLAISIPLLLNRAPDQKETRTQAAQTAKVYFTPSTTASAPLQKQGGDTFTVDLMLDPSTNTVSFIKFDITYDATKLAVSGQNALVINTNAFPATIEGPLMTSGRVAALVGIGSDPTKGIIATTKVASITFVALQGTSTPTEIKFGTLTQALSIASNASASENVLGTMQSAYVKINASSVTPTVIQPMVTGFPSPTSITPTTVTPTTVNPTTVTPTTVTPTTVTPTTVTPTTITPTSTTPSPSTGVTTSPSPTIPGTTTNPTFPPTSGPTPTKEPTGFRLVLELLLHGIGSAGDNPNRTGSEFSNKNPIHQERMMNVEVVNSDNQVVATKVVPAFYNSDEGTFFSHVDVPTTLPNDEYVIKIKADRYLRKLMPGFFKIEPGKTTKLPETDLIAGDINGDNTINIIDYSILYDCGYGSLKPLPMINAKSQYKSKACQEHAQKDNADINDNGIIEKSDYNLFLRELSVQFGE